MSDPTGGRCRLPDCGKPLDADGPSEWWCDDQCHKRWIERHGTVPPLPPAIDEGRWPWARDDPAGTPTMAAPAASAPLPRRHRGATMTTRPPATAPDERIGDLGQLARALGGDETSFTGELLRLIAKAQTSPENLLRLAMAFPRQVRAYQEWMASRPEPTTDELLAALDAYGPEPSAPTHLRDEWLAITYERLGQMIVEAWQRGRGGGNIAGRAPHSARGETRD